MLKDFISAIRNRSFSEKSVPWVLLAACILAFGVFLPQLGYYQDDWTFVYNHYVFGDAGIIDFMNVDGRPYTAWIFLLGFRILGYKPLAWQITALLLKWLTGVFIWFSFKAIWPEQGWQNLTAALIFLLYPFFTLQPLAVTYTIHWMGYFLYALSIYLMLQYLVKQQWVYVLFSLLTQALSLFTLEYYAGIELLRPLFLWLALGSLQGTSRQKLSATIKLWFPYLVVTIFYFIWRGFIYEAPSAGRNAPTGLTLLLENPLSALISIGLPAIPDIVLTLVSSWYKILEPEAVDFSRSINRYAFLLGGAGFITLQYYLSRQKTAEEKCPSASREMFIFGVAALLLGLLPAFAGGYVIHTKLAPWNSRFSLGSLFGAALIITSLIDVIVKIPKTRWLIIAALFGLLVGWHLRSANDFRWGWEKQVNFFRQLYLRAPGLEPGTAILSGEEFLIFMGNYATSYGIDLIYENEIHNVEKARKSDYWVFSLAEFPSELDEHLQGTPFSIGTDNPTPRAGISFQGEPEGSIVILFEPEIGHCLWVMRPEYADYKALSQPMRQLSSISFIDRIKNAPENPDSFLLKYLYTNPEKDWCYYYQKADLANQYEEWDEVVRLWETAGKNELKPENGFELLPFIEAFAHSGDWETAVAMTKSSQKTARGIDPLLCGIWSDLEAKMPSSESKETAIATVRNELKCNPD